MKNDRDELAWEEISTEHIIRDKWIDFRKSAWKFPDGTVFEPFYSYSRRDYVVIVASDTDGRYICVRQFRQGIREVPSVMFGDEIRIRQIVLNITNNAIKYTSEGNVAVHFSFDRMNNRLKCRVSDTGMGIKDEDLGKLFSSFQRLDETKNRNVEGTGLGLNITKQLAEMMV